MLRYQGIGILLVLLVIIFYSCSPTTRFRVLSFFFDGVPKPDQKIVALVDTTATDSLNPNTPAPKRSAHRVEFNFHPPFREKMCDLCHNSSESNRLSDTQLNLCGQCHDNFSDNYSVLHGPVATGLCTTCHNPHQSKYEKLLKRSGQELCFFCHVSRDVLKNEVHEEIGEGNCTECHNPHGGEESPFLY